METQGQIQNLILEFARARGVMQFELSPVNEKTTFKATPPPKNQPLAQKIDDVETRSYRTVSHPITDGTSTTREVAPNHLEVTHQGESRVTDLFI